MRFGQNKRTTIEEVAKQSGVSKTTISRYLNGKYENISIDTRERIRSVIEELDYRPNRMAQGLKARNSRLIGCLISDISSPFSAYILKGINDVCEEADYQVLFANGDDNPERERRAIEGLLESQVDGLIVNTNGENDDWLLSLHQQGVPLVLADRALAIPGKLDTVTTDNYESAYRGVAFLREAGYAHVAFFTQGNRRVNPRILRYQGYCDAVRDFYGQADGKELREFSIQNQIECVRELQKFRDQYPGERIALLAVNGVTMLHILHCLQTMEIQLGWWFGICGFDDWGWASLIPPGITTISQDSQLVGCRAAELLLKRIEDPISEPPIYVELKNNLEVRGSTIIG